MDIALYLKDNPGYKFKSLPADIKIENGDVKTDRDLETAILVSLFTDRRAQASDKVTGNYLGGWWGDKFLSDAMGSRLWLLDRSGVTRGTINLARVYCVEALQWLVKDGAVASFNIDITAREDGNGLNIAIAAMQPTGRLVNFNYSYLWQQIEDSI